MVVVGIFLCLCFITACDMNIDNGVSNHTDTQESSISDGDSKTSGVTSKLADIGIGKANEKWVKSSSRTYFGSGENANQLGRELSYEYDDNGRKIREVETKTNFLGETYVETRTYEYELDNDGRKVKETMYTEDSSGTRVNMCYGYEYDIDGKTSKKNSISRGLYYNTIMGRV